MINIDIDIDIDIDIEIDIDMDGARYIDMHWLYINGAVHVLPAEHCLYCTVIVTCFAED